jgi:hypothetical protein
MSHATNGTQQSVAGTYGKLIVTYTRTKFTWTVTVYQGTLRINELCSAWDEASPAFREAQRIATAAFAGETVEQIVAAKPSNLVLAAVASILDTVPGGEHRQVRPTMAHAHLAPLADPQLRAIRIAGDSANRTVYAGQATRATLQALARKGYGTLNFENGLGRRKVIESLTLNDRGLTQAEVSLAAA